MWYDERIERIIAKVKEHAKESETSAEPISRAPVPGHAAGYAVGDEAEFDAREVVRRARGY